MDILISLLERAMIQNDALAVENGNLKKQAPSQKEEPYYLVDGIPVSRDDTLWIVTMFNKLRRERENGTYENPSNMKIPLIKEVRQRWDYGLKEAKDIVETVLAL
jgi:Ribosomal protein L7/L12 C-terminal domain